MDFNLDTDVSELILSCREHNDAAFVELVRRYTPMMHKVIAGFSDSPLDAEEMLHEACVALHAAAMRYDLSQSDVTFGLYARICVSHRMVDLVRASRPASVDSIDSVGDTESSDSIETSLVSRETFEWVMDSAKRVLSDYEYKVLMLHIQGYKTAEIAKSLGKNAKSVDNAKARLFRRLRETLGGISD